MNGEMLTKCSVCGAQLLFKAEVNIVNCSWCGRINERPKSSPEKRVTMELADELRDMGEFAEAQHRYLNVLEASFAEHRARWGLLLCKYGVMYVEDSTGGSKKRLITCRRSLPSSFRDEAYYQMVLEQAAPEIRATYEKDAEYIDKIQAEIRRLRALNEKPYDVFLCYKETAPEGGRTEDSGIAHYIYNELTRCNYRVFFAPESLKEKAGANYEAAIFCAVETSRVMLALGTKKEYFESPWVRSEWKRYLEHVDIGEEKLLIPLFRHASDLPNTFQMRMIQGFSVDEPFYLEDVKTRLHKSLSPAQPSPQDQEQPEYTLAMIYLEDEKFEDAEKLLDELLRTQPQNPKIWLAKAMAAEQVRQEEAFSQLDHDLMENYHFRKALQFASGSMKERLEGYRLQNEQKFQETARKEAEEKARREAEERARAEAARQEAAEKTRRAEEAKFFYEVIDQDSAEITSFVGQTKKLSIPRELGGHRVTSIGSNAFRNCSSLTGVTIPDTVTKIGYGAFYKCTNLTSILIPNSVTNIGERAFWECCKLTNVSVPDSVTSIGAYAFWRGGGLTRKTSGHKWIRNGLCAYCGGNFDRAAICKSCGREKDY